MALGAPGASIWDEMNNCVPFVPRNAIGTRRSAGGGRGRGSGGGRGGSGGGGGGREGSGGVVQDRRAEQRLELGVQARAARDAEAPARAAGGARRRGCTARSRRPTRRGSPRARPCSSPSTHRPAAPPRRAACAAPARPSRSPWRRPPGALRPPRRSARSARTSARSGTSAPDPCDRPCRARARSRRLRARLARQLLERLGEDDELDRAVEVVERGEHHRVALLGPQALGLADDPADRHPVAVAARRRAPPSVQSVAAASAGRERLQRMRGDEQPDRLLLGREQLGAIELRGGDRRVARRRRRPRCRPPAAAAVDRSRGRRSRPGRSARPAGPSGRPPAPAPARSACPCGWRRSIRTRRT